MGLEQLADDVKKAGEGMQKLDDQLKESVDEYVFHSLANHPRCEVNCV